MKMKGWNLRKKRNQMKNQMDLGLDLVDRLRQTLMLLLL